MTGVEATSDVVDYNTCKLQRRRETAMIDFLWLKALAKALVLPPTGPLLVAAIGIGIQSRLPRIGRALAAVSLVGLLVLSMPIVADRLSDLVGTSAPLDLAAAKEAKAIVILGAGIRRDAPEYGGDTLGTLTLERVRYGARVARLTGLPVFVSGGSVLSGEAEAVLMRAALVDEFGIAVRWIEPRSRTTRENAQYSAAMLREAGIGRVVLVAHAFDMRRAAAEFAAEGIATVAAPTGRRSGIHRSPLDFVPSMAGLQSSYFATYELLGNFVRIASGR
jgi:uncharacterized SAM-binding protein YcdF (DUF218 family)